MPSTDGAPSAEAPEIVLLDACVLAPTTVRELLFLSAEAGLHRPRWSARIEAEWTAAAAKAPTAPPEALIQGEVALARARFPDALVSGFEAREETLSLPDWNDRHVLAAAIEAGAARIVTDNLRDFPRRALSAFGLFAESADSFLWRLLSDAPDRPEVLARYAATMAPDLADDVEGLARLFKRARLPRFAKSLRASSPRAASPHTPA